MTKEGRIPSLDGWRGVSIILVIAGHQLVDGGSLPSTAIGSILQKWFTWHLYGVQIFFVISGFLITHLLLNEYTANKEVSFRGFYIRRIFRILPAYYFFLLTVFILSIFYRHETIGTNAWLKAIFFFSNFQLGGGAWTLAHTWSLSVEEQYYLFWPLFFSKLQYRKWVPLLFVCIAPVCRIINYAHPEWIGNDSFLIHADAIFWGAMFAMYWKSPVFTRFLRYSKPIVAITILLVICERNGVAHTGLFTKALSHMFFSLSVIVFIYKSLQAGTILYKVMNTRFLVFIGGISYSLYLWQQLFYPVSILGSSILASFPINILLIFLLGFLSNRFIERPFLALRTNLLPTNRIKPKRIN